MTDTTTTGEDTVMIPTTSEDTVMEPAATTATAEPTTTPATGPTESEANTATSAPVVEKEKKKKHKEHKSKKEKKHKKDKHRHKKKHRTSENTDAATAPTEDQGDVEDEEEEEDVSEEESSSSDESPDDDEGVLSDAEIHDPVEEKRRAERRKRKALKKKLKAKEKSSGASKKRKRARDASKFFEIEAEVSSDEEVSGDEEEKEEGDTGFIKDLVVPDEEIYGRDSEKRRTKKSGRVRELEMVDDDFELIQENLGLEVRHSNLDEDIKDKDEDDQTTGQRSRLKKGLKEKTIDYVELERKKRLKEKEERERKARGETYPDEDEGMDDFLAPEDDGETMDARPKKKQESKMEDFIEKDIKIPGSSKPGGGELSGKQRERLKDLFGTVDTFFGLKKGKKSSTGSDDEDGAYQPEDEEAQPEPESEEDEADRLLAAKIQKREPKHMAEKSDQVKEREKRVKEILTTDLPERLYTRYLKRAELVKGLDEQEQLEQRQEEATWIYEQLFGGASKFNGATAALSTRSLNEAPRSEASLVPTIANILTYIQVDHFEVHYIANYRREHWCGSAMDPSARLTEDELIRVDEFDEKWCELGQRRQRLLKLLADYRATSYISQLHVSDASGTNSRKWIDFATPNESALLEWSRLLSQYELSGTLELEDLQDALTVLAAIESCKKRQTQQSRQDQREFDRRERRERRQQARREREEYIIRMQAEISARREAAIAAGETPMDEEFVKPEPIPEDSGDEKGGDHPMDEGEMQDAVSSVLSRNSKKTRSTHKFFSLAKAWSIPGIPELTAALGLTPSELHSNLSINYQQVSPRDQPWNVDYLSSDALKYQKVKSSEEALAVARRYAAFLIAYDPLIRRHVRKEFMEHGEIWTFPTAKGIREIDETHEYFTVKRLVSKPLPRMHEHPAQFLLIHQAEQEGFIRVEFRLPKLNDPVNRVPSLSMEEPEADAITASLCSFYCSTGTGPDARLWNVERRGVIHDCMATFLLPLCHTYARNILLKHGMEFVTQQISKKLINNLSMKGFQPPPMPAQDEKDEDDSSSRKKSKKKNRQSDPNWRILSIIVGDQWTPSQVVVLNRYGGVIDHADFHFLKSNAQARSRTGEPQSESERNQYIRKKEDGRKFIQLIETHQPKLIVVDATNMESRAFKDELVSKILVDYPQIRVEYVDPEVSRIYMNSARAELEFKEYPRNLRQAISLGRQALDPISELAGLYSGPIDSDQWSETANTSAQLMHSIQSGRHEGDSFKKDILAAATNALQNDMLALSLHPLQRKIPTRLLLTTMQRVLTRMVNYVGVDINMLVTRPWLTGTLQFVNGLGPIKARHLLDYVKKQGYLGSREELLNPELAELKEGEVAVKDEDGKKRVKSAATSEEGESKEKEKSDKDNSEVIQFGPCIHKNCAGFIIIHQNASMEHDEVELNPLDETRIHPFNYQHASQVVMDAMELQISDVEAEIAQKAAKELKHFRREDDDEDEEMGMVSEEENKKKEEKRIQEAHKIATAKVYNKHIREMMYPDPSELAARHQQLSELDFDAMDAQRIEAGEPSELETYQAIRSELMHPYADIRQVFHPFQSPSAHRLFYLLTGETSRTLREGMILPVVINGIHPGAKGAYVRLDSGIRGFLALRNISDTAPQSQRRDQFSDQADVQREIDENLAWIKVRLTIGLSLNARIIRIEKEKFSVELSTKSSDLNQSQWVANADERKRKADEIATKYGHPKVEDEVDEIEQALYFNDKYLYVGSHPDDAAVLAAEAGPQKAEKRFRQRNINHTLFRNISREEAIAELKDKPIGEVIVRPSSIGTNHLTLTWKVSDQELSTSEMAPDAVAEKGIYFHVDVKEEQKPNELEIGHKLIVKEDKYVYEDLDEIAARFITPMVRWVNELTAHKNFRFGNEAEIHGILFAEKQQDRNKFPYALHFATRKEKAGAFQFSFLPNVEVKSSSFIVVPDGYQYRDRTYSSVNSLLAAIKAEMSKKVGVAPPAGSTNVAKSGSRTATTARAPASLPPYASSTPAAVAGARPPYAPAAPQPGVPSNALPPYAGANNNVPPYAAPRPPYQQQPAPQAMPPYGMRPPQPQMPYQPYGAPMQPQQPYQQQPPYQQPYPQQQRPPQQVQPNPYAPYAPQQPMMMPQQQQRPPVQHPPQQQQPGPSTSGFINPARLGLVEHSQPSQQQQSRSRWG